MTGAGLLLAAALLAREAAGSESSAPALSIDLAPARAAQGSIVVVTAKSPVPLAALLLADGDHRLPLESDAGRTRFLGLLGIDFEAAPGERTLALEGRDLRGGEVTLRATLRIVPGRFAVQRITVDPRLVEPPEKEKHRIARERQEFARAFRSSTPDRLWGGHFLLPVAGGAGGNFGARRVYNGRTRGRHAGLDIAAPEGAPVVASSSGRVALAGDFYFTGGTVVLDHGQGLFTTYFHLSRLDVREGDLVAAGQMIGAVGATGRATGPHLHWAARLAGARVNPAGLLSVPAP